jgi:glycosyltransferase involved in cell wall biosynthesis
MPKFNKPLISIITSSWNREKYLKKLIFSLMNQTYKNFEWIIGNDGSKDNTDKLIKKISKKVNFKITYVNSTKRIGKSKLVNIMLTKVKGKFVVECDSDDYFKLNALKNLLGIMSDQKITKSKNFAGIIGQNLSTEGVSQTFKRKIPQNIEVVKWENLIYKIDGDATLLTLSKLYKNRKYPEVDFLITESSLLNKVFKNKLFILTPKVVKIMNRNANNSVSFNNKMKYTKGSAYCVSINETQKIFNSRNFISKIKTIINYWRYTIHGDIRLNEAINLVKPIKNNKLYLLLYPISLLISVRDVMLKKVEKTHIEFNKNIKNTKINVKIFNK